MNQPLNLADGVHIEAVADFNGDGRSDLPWRHHNGRNGILWLMNGSRLAAARYIRRTPVGYSLAGSGDYNADGNVDLLWLDESTGDLSVWMMKKMRVMEDANLGALPAGFEPF